MNMDNLVQEIAETVSRTEAQHTWEPFDAVCSCGVVPPVVDGFHTVEAHRSEAVAHAILPLVLREITKARARELRVAADSLSVGMMFQGGYIDTVVLPDTLRSVADEIEESGK